jgi:hypothetical protein
MIKLCPLLFYIIYMPLPTISLKSIGSARTFKVYMNLANNLLYAFEVSNKICLPSKVWVGVLGSHHVHLCAWNIQFSIPVLIFVCGLITYSSVC